VRLLADESCDFAVVRALRGAGHDVVAVAEIAAQSSDEEIIRLALRERRVLVTEDKDFGQMVFAAGKATLGVVFLRYPGKTRQWIARDLVSVVNSQAERLIGCFITVQPGRIRFTRLP
jgi:predicted nuclease of predicted toxin-antitoxin system